MHSLAVAPKKPPRMHITKAVNKLDIAQLTMSSTIASTIKPVDNDISKIIGEVAVTTTNTNLLTRQLSADKATMTKKKHLHFHSPLVKGPMKMTTATTIMQQYPDSLFANIMSDNTAEMNAITTTIETKDGQTIETSNVTTTTTSTTSYYQRDHDYNLHSHAHHRNEHSGTVIKALSLKETTAASASTTAVEATGSSVARTRLDRGCTSLMYACQHGDISEVIAQLSNKVYYIHVILSILCNSTLHYAAITTIQMLNNK